MIGAKNFIGSLIDQWLQKWSNCKILSWDSLKPQKETFQERIFKSTKRFLFWMILTLWPKSFPIVMYSFNFRCVSRFSTTWTSTTMWQLLTCFINNSSPEAKKSPAEKNDSSCGTYFLPKGTYSKILIANLPGLLSKSLTCLLLQLGLKPFLVT